MGSPFAIPVIAGIILGGLTGWVGSARNWPLGKTLLVSLFTGVFPVWALIFLMVRP